jgi:hypothetical protein
LEGSGSGLVDVLPRNSNAGSEEYQEKKRAVGVPAEFRTEHFSNTSLKSYRYTNPLDMVYYYYYYYYYSYHHHHPGHVVA